MRAAVDSLRGLSGVDGHRELAQAEACHIHRMAVHTLPAEPGEEPGRIRRVLVGDTVRIAVLHSPAAGDSRPERTRLGSDKHRDSGHTHPAGQEEQEEGPRQNDRPPFHPWCRRTNQLDQASVLRTVTDVSDRKISLKT